MTGTRDVIAAFDFDGTLTRRDTLSDFLLQTFGFPGLAAGVLSNGPVLLKYALGLVSNHTAK
jgi:phosphatidylglycerophosphatase C